MQLPNPVVNNREPEFSVFALEVPYEVRKSRLRFRPLFDDRHVSPSPRRWPSRSIDVWAVPSTGKTKKRRRVEDRGYWILTHWAAKRTRYAATSRMAKSMLHLPTFGYFVRAPCRRGVARQPGAVGGVNPTPRVAWQDPSGRRPDEAPQDRESRRTFLRDRRRHARQPEERPLDCVPEGRVSHLGR